MPSLDDAYPEIRAALADRYGSAAPSPVGPRDDRFLALATVLLGRSLEPRKLQSTLDALRDAGLLDAPALAEADPAEIAEALRPSGAKLAPKAIAPLKKLAAWAESLGAEGLADASTESLRDDLRAINGIGPSTADSLLLEALDRTAYPVDRASYRIFARHGWIDSYSEYDEARSVLEGREPDDPAALRRLSSWLDRLGTEFCKASRPKCEKCPLNPFLPEGGPIEP